MPAIARAFFTLVTLTRSGRVQSILAIAIQEMTGCFRASPLNMTKTQVALVTLTRSGRVQLSLALRKSVPCDLHETLVVGVWMFYSFYL